MAPRGRRVCVPAALRHARVRRVRGGRIDEIATTHANAALDRLDLDNLQPSQEFEFVH